MARDHGFHPVRVTRIARSDRSARAIAGGVYSQQHRHLEWELAIELLQRCRKIGADRRAAELQDGFVDEWREPRHGNRP